MSILRLSKAIKDEVMPLFYSEKTFCFYYSPPYEEGTPLHPKTDITVRLMNVTLFYEANDYDRDHETLTHYFARVGPLQFFRGATIVRHSIIVELHLREWSGDDTVTIGSPLFRGLEQLTGFKTVTITFAVKEWMDTEQWEKLYAGFEPLLSAMSKVLEPTLGSCSATSELVSREGGCPGEDTVSWFSLRGITFHPRDHLASISKAKKDTMNMEQSMNSMRIN